MGEGCRTERGKEITPEVMVIASFPGDDIFPTALVTPTVFSPYNRLG